MTTEISRIDQALDVIYREIRMMEVIEPGSTKSWQRAWDRHPDLRERETALYRERGAAQRERDQKAANRLARPIRLRSTKCPTCGHRAAA